MAGEATVPELSRPSYRILRPLSASPTSICLEGVQQRGKPAGLREEGREVERAHVPGTVIESLQALNFLLLVLTEKNVPRRVQPAVVWFSVT